MQVYRLPVLSDNYIFLLHDPDSHTAAVVDPARSQPVLEQLQALGAELTAIFNTHHHSDHAGGLRAYMARGATLLVAPGSGPAETAKGYLAQLGDTPAPAQPIEGR